MMLTPERLRTLFVRVLERVTGLGQGRVLVEDEAGPRPAEGLYCTLRWERMDPLPQNGGDYRDDHAGEYLPGCDPGCASGYDKEEPITQSLRNETLNTLRLSFWGPGAFGAGLRTQQALQEDARWADLWRVCGFADLGALCAEGAAAGGGMQTRTWFEFSFYACFGTRCPADWFDVSAWDVGRAERKEAFETPDRTRLPCGQEDCLEKEDSPEKDNDPEKGDGQEGDNDR